MEATPDDRLPEQQPQLRQRQRRTDVCDFVADARQRLGQLMRADDERAAKSGMRQEYQLHRVV